MTRGCKRLLLSDAGVVDARKGVGCVVAQREGVSATEQHGDEFLRGDWVMGSGPVIAVVEHGLLRSLPADPGQGCRHEVAHDVGIVPEQWEERLGYGRVIVPGQGRCRCGAHLAVVVAE